MNSTVFEFSALGLEHESALADYLADYATAGERDIHGYFGKPEWSHAETVARFAAWARGEELDGWVPSTTRFLLANGRIVGNYNFRHELTDALMLYGGNCGYSVRPSERRKGYATMLLRDAQELGRTLGLERMLVTCSVDNIGSSRAIENNGGIRQDVVYSEDWDAQIARYWISL